MKKLGFLWCCSASSCSASRLLESLHEDAVLTIEEPPAIRPDQQDVNCIDLTIPRTAGVCALRHYVG
ncbi:hypothetical protein GN958_ATG05287 [Phytophthora infestans]|uniref:Uncharacterized protein n=1 Tax=Phytophthora infestans TaxID=4787 RepID=A0A8S9V1X5_PHYIN|nr:hypothetical protein GN958_ATG05287 [Phytophthora infestans]